MLKANDHRQYHSAGEADLWSWLEGAGPVAISFSFLLHIAVVIVMTVGLPWLPEPPRNLQEEIVAVEFVEVAEKTESNKAESRQKNEQEKSRAKQVKPSDQGKSEVKKPKSAPMVDAREQPLTVRDDKSKVPPPPAEEQAEPEPPKSFGPENPDRPNKRPKRPKAEKPKEESKEKPRDINDVVNDSVLKNLQISENSAGAEEEGEQSQTAAPKVPSLGGRVTVSERMIFERNLEKCWNVLSGANFDKAYVIEFIITVRPDRTLQNYRIKNQLRYNTDPSFKASADAAARALYNPACQPFELPPGKYEEWKEFPITFDPAGMF